MLVILTLWSPATDDEVTRLIDTNLSESELQDEVYEVIEILDSEDFTYQDILDELVKRGSIRIIDDYDEYLIEC